MNIFQTVDTIMPFAVPFPKKEAWTKFPWSYDFSTIPRIKPPRVKTSVHMIKKDFYAYDTMTEGYAKMTTRSQKRSSYIAQFVSMIISSTLFSRMAVCHFIERMEPYIFTETPSNMIKYKYFVIFMALEDYWIHTVHWQLRVLFLYTGACKIKNILNKMIFMTTRLHLSYKPGASILYTKYRTSRKEWSNLIMRKCVITEALKYTAAECLQ